ncbi:MAG TPA: DNA alkylation repair protein [Vicinamibacterales bacterium]
MKAAARSPRSVVRQSQKAQLAEIRGNLHSLADERRAHVSRLFFKTGPGQYGEGDVFIGATVPQVRSVARAHRGTPLATVLHLLESRIHEDRLLALLMLVDTFQRGDTRTRREVHEAYLARTACINNWDLVDTSAAAIVGGYLDGRGMRLLTRLAKSSSLWERRIAIIATFHDIRQGRPEPTFRIADILMDDGHDLIHKAVGWMLREAGKRDVAALRAFLSTRHNRMPRAMLRYAIERFPEHERKKYLRRATL